MTLLPEDYYFSKEDFPVEKAVLVTAKVLGKYCSFYKAVLMNPLKKKEKEIMRVGNLPEGEEDKVIEEIIGWISKNNMGGLTFDFRLLMGDLPYSEDGYDGEEGMVNIYHGFSCCASLEVDYEQFAELQKVWKDNGLPEDLFYPDYKAVEVKKDPGWFLRFLHSLGFSGESVVIYSPKQWEEKEKKSDK